MSGSKLNTSGLRDNHSRGNVADFLNEKIHEGSILSIVSAYFTIYAYDALEVALEQTEHLDFLFGEPSFVNRLDPNKTEKKAFLIDDDGLHLSNQLADLRNQISFIAGGDVARKDVADAAFAESLKISSVKETTRQAQAHFTIWAKKPAAQRKTRDLISAIGGDFFKLLDGLSIARSRRQVSSYYADEMKHLDGFPKRPPPKAIHAPIDLSARFLSFEQLDDEISRLRLALYHPSSFLREDLPAELRAAYEDKIHGGFTQEGRERILVAMMKVNFLKRLESSVDSFRLTLQRTIDKIDRLEQRIADFAQHVDNNPEIDFDSLTPDQFEDPDFDKDEFTIGGRRRIHLGHLKLPEWLQSVRNDRTQLQFLLEKTKSVTPARDGKLAELQKLIEMKAREPSINRDGEANRKVLVFTAFADTARYLYKHAGAWARTELKIDTALVCGDGGNAASLGRTDYDDILTNFSPRAKRRAGRQSRADPALLGHRQGDCRKTADSPLGGRRGRTNRRRPAGRISRYAGVFGQESAGNEAILAGLF